MERDGRFLLVAERDGRGLLFNQPAGHLEADESLVAAMARETLMEDCLAGIRAPLELLVDYN